MEDGSLVYQDNLLDVEPLEMSENYKLEEEDPSVYNDEQDADKFCPRREWPEKQLAKKKTLVAPAEDSDLITSLLRAHHLHVDVLQSLGVDPCK